MNSTKKSNQKDSLEEFLQEFVLQIDQPEQVDLLLEILKELRSITERSSAAPAQGRRQAEARADRYDILKMYPDRIARIGFVKGAENARRMLSSLPALGDSVYFLHESRGAAQRMGR